MSVPWSASKPRMKYWTLFPPPASWLTIRPGTWRRRAETWAGERYFRSSRVRWTDDADSAGAVSSISIVSPSGIEPEPVSVSGSGAGGAGTPSTCATRPMIGRADTAGASAHTSAPAIHDRREDMSPFEEERSEERGRGDRSGRAASRRARDDARARFDDRDRGCQQRPAIDR